MHVLPTWDRWERDNRSACNYLTSLRIEVILIQPAKCYCGIFQFNHVPDWVITKALDESGSRDNATGVSIRAIGKRVFDMQLFVFGIEARVFCNRFQRCSI